MRFSRLQSGYVRSFESLFGCRSLLCAWLRTCVLIVFAAAPFAQASVSLLLEQPYGKLNTFAPAGHSAIYLDHVCAETPLKLRPCRPGELGVVLSRYNHVGGRDWVAMPLIPYLYAVDSIGEIPETIDRDGEQRLREVYREQYLQTIAPTLANGSAPGGNWTQLVGSAFDRTIYAFRVNTTAEQDARLIAYFNDRHNVEGYNGAFRNCADFTRVTLNHFYPHAIRRNYIADFGLTSPKSVARSLSHYAAKHPGTGFEVFVIPQIKGELPRSHSNTDLVEGILKRYGVPLVVVSPISTAVVLAAYLGHGRFSMPKHVPILNLAELSSNESSDAMVRSSPLAVPVLPGASFILLPAPASTWTLPIAPSSIRQVSLVDTGVVP